MFSILIHLRNVIFLVLTLVGHLPLAILFVWKSLVTLVVVCFWKDIVPMKALDQLAIAALDYDIENKNSKNINANIGVMCELKGQVNSTELFDKFVDRVVNSEGGDIFDSKHPHVRFHQNIEKFGGYWFFKTLPGKLTYENHVTCLNLVGDTTSTSIEEEICKWLKTRYGKTSPLWGILLIFRESKDTIFVLKIHHVLADGYSLLHILDLLTATEYKYQVKNFYHTRWEKIKIFTEMAFNVFWHNLKMITVPQSPFANRDDQEIFLTLQTISVSKIKDIRKAAQVRFQSVVFYIMRTYLENLAKMITPKKAIPQRIIVVHSLPWPNHPNRTLCNHATGFSFCLGLDPNKKNVLESIISLNEIFEDFHGNHVDKAYHYFALPLAALPASLASLGIVQKGKNKISSFYTQLIGSEEYKSLLGWECSSLYRYVTPPKQKGIHFTCLTTSSEIRISIMGPKSIFPSQQKADELSKEWIQSAVDKMTSSVMQNIIYR